MISNMTRSWPLLQMGNLAAIGRYATAGIFASTTTLKGDMGDRSGLYIGTFVDCPELGTLRVLKDHVVCEF